MRISCWSSDVCSSDLLGVFHAVTRSVRDSAALLDAICGPPRHHPYSLPRPETPFLAAVGRDPGRLRIACTVGTPDDVDLHPECRAAVERAARLAADFAPDVDDAVPEIDHNMLLPPIITVLPAHLPPPLAPGNQVLAQVDPMGGWGRPTV